MAGAGAAIGKRLAPLRGRIAFARAAEDLQAGLAAGAVAALVVALLRWSTLVPAPPALAATVGACVALAFPAAGLLLRRLTERTVATLADERLGLAERAATALALERGEAAATPLAPLVAEDAVLALSRVPATVLRRAFRPRFSSRRLGAALGCGVLAALLLRAEPWSRDRETPADPAAAAREKEERKEAAKAARKVLEEAKAADEAADPKHAALHAAAAEVRRQAEELLRKTPPRPEAMAAFQRMGELARERQELLAGVDAGKLKEWKASGELSKMDPELQGLLSKLLGADLAGLNSRLASLDAAMKGLEGSPSWTSEGLAALQKEIDDLAAALEKSRGELSDRGRLKDGLGTLGNAELLKEISGRLAKLMETLKQQGWEACKNQGGLNPDGLGDSDPGEPLAFTDEELQAMLDRLKELQELADLGLLTFCQNCGLSGGT